MNAAAWKWMSVFQTENKLVSIKTKTGGKKSWQTIVRKIRAVSRVVNRHRAVKVMKVVKELEAVKVSRADSKVARVVSKVASKLVDKKVVSKATANSIAAAKWVRS
jgi:hypothetical protein